MQRNDGLFGNLAEVSRRDFMKLCSALAATMGLSSKAGAQMSEALTSPSRPPVVLNRYFVPLTQQSRI